VCAAVKQSGKKAAQLYFVHNGRCIMADISAARIQAAAAFDGSATVCADGDNFIL